MHEVDGHEIHGTEATIDTTHELVDGSAQILVFFNVLSRRDGKLCQDDLREAPPEHLEQSYERVKHTLPIHSGCCVRKSSSA